MKDLKKKVCVFLTLLGLLVEVSESHWLLCGVRSICHLAPWSNVTTVSTTPSAKASKTTKCTFLPWNTQKETAQYGPSSCHWELFCLIVAEKSLSIHPHGNVCSLCDVKSAWERTLCEHAGHVDTPEWGDGGEVCFASGCRVKVAFQRLGEDGPPVVWHVNGSDTRVWSTPVCSHT